MPRFTREYLPNNVSGTVAWGKLTDAIRAGNTSVEVLARVVNGEAKWELRSWDGIRTDESNSAGASENTDH
ncbi:MAG: hypothetical protein HY699_11480 [Deltaproteobacteria bacterium]|nr:hypothetical protein [Deltaproteobacteria bacterium]